MKETKEITIIKKTGNLFIQFCYILGIFITIGIGISAFVVTFYFNNKYFEYTTVMQVRIDNLLINIIGVIIFLAVIFLVKKLLSKIPNKALILVVTIIMMLAASKFISFAKILPQADQECMTYAATEFMDGKYYWLEQGNYLDKYPFQLGFIYLVEMIYNFSGDKDPIVMQNMNVFCIGIIILLLYKFTSIMFENKNTNKIFCILMLGFLPIIFFATFIYGNIIGLMFALIASICILIYKKERKIRYLIVSSISIGLAVLLKKNYQIFFIGMAILLVLDFIENRDKKIFIGIILSAICIVSFSKLVYVYTEHRTGIQVSDRNSDGIIFTNGTERRKRK